MSNRVEDLERQVAELQAAVNGLTEELVEMKERVRQVEDAQEVSVAADAAEPAEPAEPTRDEAAEEPEATGGERRTHSDDHVEVVERTDDGPAAGETEAADDDASEGDVIVPEQEATTPDAEAAAAEADAEGESDEESDSDIIVA
ncbi:DUF7518 family protein [Halorubrum lipolyticum]|uniref:BZIP transcription factor n=1 Tax=Halorubrum lipolyticum DSM 21995 TaxID=1227482 RepID=M0NYV6_9EURY|nr:hypothetical protein [Halorubrum lipolyticum]EMA61750.1 hypothetical protein C469_06159 [Halorubrum lipolyticum DSM 21995]